MIELRGISKEFESPSGIPLQILQNVDFTVEANSFTLISGPSGVGKSTLLHVLGLLDFPSRGSYFLDSDKLEYADSDRLASIRGSTFGFVFQELNLLPRRTAWENVISPLDYASKGDKVSGTNRALDLMRELKIVDRGSHFPHQMSVGEQQRVALARALVRSPRIVLADEPSGSLDETLANQLADLFAEQVIESGLAVVVVSHDLDLWAPRVRTHFVLEKGTLRAKESR